MTVKVFCLVISMVALLEAVPTDYVLETWSKTNPQVGSCKIENRLGLTTNPKIETTETEEVAEDEELNRLFNNFWAVDHLPKKSPFVSIQKLPDVYIDDSDLPCPISDVMPVERSEITEEAKDLQSPEFGERPLYDASMQTMDNVGGKNLRQYPNYMPYPQYAVDQYPSYDDVSYYSDNNTQYPQEEIDCPDVPLKREEEKIEETRSDETKTVPTTVQVSTSEETKTSTETETEKTTPKSTKEAPKLNISTTKKIESATSTEKSSTVEIKIPVSNVTYILTEKTSTSPAHSENVMKISATTHKIQKKKEKK